MGIFWNVLTHTLHHLTILLLFHQVLSGDCELLHSGIILNCSDLSSLPNASLYEGIETINFHNNNFTELTPYVFKKHNFHNLKAIILRHNNISHIYPNAFSDMWSVRDLVLYGNNLTYLPENAFVGLKGLEYLDLGHNKLVLIEGAAFKPLQSLETLDLSYNNIKVVTPNLLENANVLELYLSGNEFEFSNEGPILESNSLTVLTLQSCKLKSLQKDLFKNLPNLVYLDISWNKIESLPQDLLKPLVHLEQLHISYNSISNINIDMFPLPSKLEILLCDGNPSGVDSNCENIVEQLQKVDMTLTFAINETETEPSQVKDRSSTFDQTSTATIQFHPKSTTTRSHHDITKPTPTVNKPIPKEEVNRYSALEKYLYTSVYVLLGYVAVLFIIFFVEICSLWSLREKYITNAEQV